MFLEKRANLLAAHSSTIARTRKMPISERSRVLETRGSNYSTKAQGAPNQTTTKSTTDTNAESKSA